MDDPLPQSPYKTLNVPKDATLATIRSAHRKLVLSCHPDKVQDESVKKQKAEQFHEVQQAYETLSDENRRQRYDEKVKLAELRAEMAEDRGSFPSRRSYEYASTRNGSAPKFEMRGNTMYETREPAGSRYDEPDVFSATYAEARPSMSRKYTEDRYTTSSSRKTSGPGRMQEERKKSRPYEEEEDERRRRERREREAERAAEAVERDQRTRRRDKVRRSDVESKSRGKFETFIQDGGSDSEADDRYYSKSKRDSPPKKRSGDEGKKRSGDERKRSGDERRKDRDEPRRSSKREAKEAYDELEYKSSLARDHINRSRDAVEILPRRPEGRNRAASTLDSRVPAPPVEKRSSGRRSSPIGRSGKDRRSPEVMESRRPSMPGHSSESSKNKSYFGASSSSRKESHRSATYQPSPEPKQPSIRRSETTPIDRMRPSNPVPSKSSNLKNMKAPSDTSDSSSESDSEVTEENYPPPRPAPLQRTTTFGISPQEGAYVMEPESFQSRPKESRRTAERPSMGSRGGSTRTPQVARAMSSAFPDERRPGLGRHETARVTPLKTRESGRGGEFFGEYSPQSPNEDTFRRSPKMSGEDERHARSYNPKQYSRRGSEEPYRDEYPGSHRPRMGRSESQQVRV
ncbi:MAG: Diphthamide biosynthesis protein 4 [Alectoria sarmentosa]|nr:MAG: Diphthamide biosynthesis protein 4 [Alectoria sarmentosa]